MPYDIQPLVGDEREEGCEKRGPTTFCNKFEVMSAETSKLSGLLFE